MDADVYKRELKELEEAVTLYLDEKPRRKKPMMEAIQWMQRCDGVDIGTRANYLWWHGDFDMVARSVAKKILETRTWQFVDFSDVYNEIEKQCKSNPI